MSKNNPFKTLLLLAGIAIIVFGIIYLGISTTQNLGKSKKVINIEKATKALDKLYDSITVNKIEPSKEQVSLEPAAVKDLLPDIFKYPAQVNNTTEDFIEIFSSTEKTGSGKDGWLIDTANDFNNLKLVVNGKTVSVRIRGLASGMAADYIISGKYVPGAFTPSNELWGEMISHPETKYHWLKKGWPVM